MTCCCSAGSGRFGASFAARNHQLMASTGAESQNLLPFSVGLMWFLVLWASHAAKQRQHQGHRRFLGERRAFGYSVQMVLWKWKNEYQLERTETKI